MKKDRILLIAEKGEMERYRTKRIIEEAEKMGHEIDLICSNDANIMIDGLFVDGFKIEISSYDIAYSIGNGFYHHYILAFAANAGVRTWPGVEHFSLSDKFFEGVFFSSIGIPAPKTVLLNSQKIDSIEKNVQKIGGFPCIIKKVTGSEGRYVGLMNSSQEILDFVKRMPQGITGKKNILLQEYIKESRGTDFRVYCVGDTVLGVIKRESNSDFRANVSLGGSAKKVDPEKELIEYAEKIMKESGLMFAGIDFIKGDKGYLVIEINTSADFKGFEGATNINVAEKILKQLTK